MNDGVVFDETRNLNLASITPYGLTGKVTYSQTGAIFGHVCVIE